MKNNQVKLNPLRTTLATCIGSSIILLTGCGGDGRYAPAILAGPALLTCDESMKTSFAPDTLTTVTLVKAFRKGEPLLLSGAATATTPIATNDVCVVKLNVGPGNPGTAGDPAASAGIGIEIWLPAPGNWNDRLHVKGGGGWQGTAESSLTTLVGLNNSSAGSPALTAMVEGAVSATTDTGHVGAAAAPSRDASWAMNPDGSINTTLWKDFSERAIHEMAVKTKALAKAFYGKDPRYSYFNGFSTGGRQAHKEAQAHPADFDGILAGAPAFNWTRFITSELYPQIVYQRDLGGVNLTAGQLKLLGGAAIAACDVVGGQHLGYIPDPEQCRYDPAKDSAVLCAGENGNGVIGSNTSANCVGLAQAIAMNKIWYGQTADGSVPDPALDNGWSISPGLPQKWYGLPRGTDVFLSLGGPAPFPIASEMVALALQAPSVASTGFRNAVANGANGWKNLSYADLARAADQGIALQAAFSNINTDDPDLSSFRNRNGKMIMYHGLADDKIFAQGSVNYYHRVANQMGGLPVIQDFYRFYLVPAMGHSFTNGTANPEANPPLPTNEAFYKALTNWVENGIAPETLAAETAAGLPGTAKSRPLCRYPSKARFVSGDPNLAASHVCS